MILLCGIAGCSGGDHASSAVPASIAASTPLTSASSNTPRVAGLTVRALSTARRQSPSLISEGNDTSDDVCSLPYCGIQGQPASLGFSSPSTDCLTWSTANVPAGVTAAFSPATTCAPNSTTLAIVPSTSYPPGPLSFTLVLTDQSNGASSSTPFSGFQVLCSTNASLCPELQILDTNDANRVVSGPGTHVSTVVGRQVNLHERQAPNAAIGTFAVSDLVWQIPNDPIASYDITASSAASPSPLPTPAGADATFYWTWPGAWSSSAVPQTVALSATMTKGSEVAIAAASTVFDVAEPAVTDLTSSGTTLTRVGAYEPGDPNAWLSFGSTFAPRDFGMIWHWSATVPPGGAGYFALTQLATTTVDHTTPGPEMHFAQTGPNRVEKDACAISTGAVHGAERASVTIGDGTSPAFPPRDSPGIPLVAGDVRTLTTHQSYKTLMIYRPDGPNSIWVPLAEQLWSWSGTARLDAANGKFVLDAGSTSSAPPAYATSDTPSFSGVLPPPAPRSCPTLPPQT